ncbi:hypothetical protein FERRO_15750 [Ferrovum sp. JA12]|uniref:hypothetical protein n=1 Tax=Ferrovum sp. JA12 TaxID=1356299 RepID=UPI0007037E41|nr:hypothetical protein [Ferrovum sp. JA12]KRH78584.1 hypothetical protein FERRO_15750 [Ferrovum sp. JA12]
MIEYIKVIRRITAKTGQIDVPESGQLFAQRFKKDRVPMEVEKTFLPIRETANVIDIFNVDAHALKRRPVGYRGNYEFSIIFEANESTIKEVINARCQE